MKEIWKPIEGFEGLYEVSNTGKVRGVDRIVKSRWGTDKVWKGKELAHSIKYDGYHKVTLMKDGISYYFSIHRLVANAFIPNPNNLPCVNHKDENPANNNVDNLEWCDVKYNSNYGNRNEKLSKSQTNHPAKSYKIFVEGIGEFPSIKEFARQYKLNYSGLKAAVSNNRPYKNYIIRRLT